jgi:hypothetical protein
MTIKVTLQGLSEVRGTLPKIPPELERRVIFDMSQIAFDTIEQGAQRHASPRSSKLLLSLFNRKIEGGRAVGHDLRVAEHAKWINAGTRPHDIRPRNKKALRWVVGNRFVFARFVRHPGYVGDGYVIRSATDALRQFSAIVDRAMKAAT